MIDHTHCQTEFEDFISDMSTNIASFGMGATESSVVTVYITYDKFVEGNEYFTIRGVLDNDTATRVEILPPNPRVTIIDDDCESVHTPCHVVCTNTCTYTSTYSVILFCYYSVNYIHVFIFCYH